MARMPGVNFVGEKGEFKMTRHDIVCIHTMGFDNAGQAAHAAHFSVAADGGIRQSRDTKFKSAANKDGNHRIIAIENEDSGGTFPSWTLPNVPDFTDAQIEANAQICAWAATTHGIPLVLCPDSKPGSRGIAYHRQGIDGNFGTFKFQGRVQGGEVWTKTFGKACPGDNRIGTLIERIIPRAVAITGGVVSAATLGLATPNQTARAEAADMLVGQDSKTGELWLISGNTKVALPKGGATASGDAHSAGNTGHKSVDQVLRMIKEMYPGSDPKFIALENDVVKLLPKAAAP